MRPQGYTDEQYIVWLEKQLSAKDTIKKLFRGIQRQLDFIAEELLNEDFKVSMKTEYELDEKGKKKKSTNNFEAFYDLLVKGEHIVKTMRYFEVTAYPEEAVPSPAKVEDSKHDGKVIF